MATRVALVAVAAALALVGASAASAAPAAITQSTSTCWQDVVNDWLVHHGNLRQTYPIPCYTQAIQNIDQYPDVQNYSNFDDDIHRALLAALHQERGGGPGAPLPPPAPSSDKGGGGKSPITRLTDALTPGSAQSVPLPLIVLGILALLLMLTALGTWIAKRMQSRRIAPATAPATPRPRRR
jgi:hypothetical protein